MDSAAIEMLTAILQIVSGKNYTPHPDVTRRLASVLAALKTGQVINAEKRIDRLQRRKELDERLLALLKEYEQD